MHLRLLKRIETSGVAVGGGFEVGVARNFETYQLVIGGTEITVLINDTYRIISHIFSVGTKRFTVGTHKFKMVGLTCRAHHLFCHLLSPIIIGHHTKFAGFVDNLVPHQAVAFLHVFIVLRLGAARCRLRCISLAQTSLTFPIHEKFGFGIIRINKHGRSLPLSSRPRPMRQNVQRGRLLIPNTPIEIITILGQRSQIDDAEVGTMRWPSIGVVGRRLTQIIEARPNELAQSPRLVIGVGKIPVRYVRPPTSL